MKILTRIEALPAEPRKIQTVEVPVPEWGDDAGVLVRVMGARERDRFEKFMREQGKPGASGKQSWRAIFASLVCCDERGRLIFNDEDVERLAQEDFRALDRIIEAAAELNAVSQEQRDALKKT